MDFQTSVRTCLTQKYASFQGRASRSEYWWFVLAYVIGAVLIALIGIRFLSTIYALALIVPVAAAGFRRLQDTGRPGWYIFIPIGISLLSYFFGPQTSFVGMDGDDMMAHPSRGMGVSALLGFVQLVVSLVFIWWLSRPSEREANAFGPRPRD